ncbi:MAG: M48 family metallopeptidase [Cyanobacteria bacterium]|nr:M48 family metallopeptidase [Cyanobacteriota bacterium]
MVKKILNSYGGSINFLILISIIALIMLIIFFISVLFIRTPDNKDVLKYFDNNFLNKATNYNKTILLTSVAQKLLTWAFLVIIIFLLKNNSYINNRITIMAAAVIFVIFNIILFLINLPLQYYQEFIVEHKFALSSQTFSSWFTDILKDSTISIIINTLGLTAIYALIIYLPKHWWIAAAAVFILFIIIASFIFPLIIDPLFYKFSPLNDAKLKQNIIDITGKAGVNVGNILVADARKKTNKVNAYFTGIGKTERIVIYDNLLNQYTKKEVLSVIAHEVGHWKYKHVIINIAIQTVAVVILFFILSLLKSGLNMGVSVKLIMIFLIVIMLISFISTPLQNYISRYFEKQADKVALDLTNDPDTQILMFVKLAKSNLSDVKPGIIIKYMVYSHPPIMERINNINSNSN